MAIIKKDINYALVEDSRPPLYTAMKYWGKKPHNIWNEYISNYTSKDGMYLDPFSGSAMSAFESFKSGRRAIALDINPLTSFVIETIASEFDFSKFKEAADIIINKINNSEIYKKLFAYKIEYKNFVVHNVKWNLHEIYEVCLQSLDGKQRICLQPAKEDYRVVEKFDEYQILNKYPKQKFRQSISFSKSFINNIGDDFSCLYTKRNLWVLSEIFDNILKVKDEIVKKQLIYAFIQTVHLSTKMCVPRSKKSNRDFSTSWGRSAYMYSKKQMEMNPLLVFQSSCFGKQSAGKALDYSNAYFKRRPIIADVNKIEFSEKKNIDIWYGIVDAKTIETIFPEKSIDFVLTDPPYGGLIQYLDLSSIWLSWLELYDDKYTPNFDKEITVNEDKTYEDFKKSFTQALLNVNKVLKDDGKLVLTFNNRNLQIWGAFLTSIIKAGFEIEKVIHQQNKRTGESNITDPYGTSATDFYIRCIKAKNDQIETLNNAEIESIIIQNIIEIINERNEPTPYQILFNGLLAKLSTSKIDISSFDLDAKKVIEKHIGVELTLYKNAVNKAGNFWWIKNKEFISDDTNTLTNRVKRYIVDYLNTKDKVSTNEILQSIFREFPNGLTPDIEVVFEILEQNAVCIKDQWTRRKND